MKNKILYPLNPKASLRNYTLDFIRCSSTPMSHIVDVGCGEMPLENAIRPLCSSYIGIDIESGFYKNKKPDVYGTAYETTLPDSSCDIVLSMQVFEHLKYPQQAIKEANRILKSNGTLIVSFPFSYPLHAAPFDYFRFTNYGLTSLLEDEGFKVEEIKEVSGLFVVFSTYLYNHFLYKFPFKPFGVAAAWLFYFLHKLESGIFILKRGNVAKYRSQFVVNYILKARKS